MTAKTEKKPVDLKSFDEAAEKHEAGIDIPLVGPDGKTELGVIVKVAGPDSKRAIEAQEAMTDELIEQQNSARLGARDAAKRGIRYLAKITMDWSPEIVVDGETLACSEANAEKLYQRHPFIRQQVDRAAGDRARFLKG